MTTHDRQDELIFDFLEGNLNPDEEQAFRLLMEESEVLSHEVRLLQNTYLKDPLPSIDALQQKLFIPHKQHGGNLSTRIYAIVLIALIYITTSVDISQPEIHKLMAGTTDNSSQIQKAVIETPIIVLDCLEKPGVRPIYQKEVQTEIETIEYHLPASELVSVLDLKTEVRLLDPEKFTLPEIKVQQPEIKKPVSSPMEKKWSNREIRKKLWRDYRLRMEKEFQSGNEPYVVPLNSNNF